MFASSASSSARRHGPPGFTPAQLLTGRAGRRAGLFGLVLVIFGFGVFAYSRGSVSEHIERIPPMSMRDWNLQYGETPPEVDLINLPDAPSLRVREARLPQHNEWNARVGRFVRFQSQHHWGVGFNNMWQEFILLAAIAEKSGRSYVFRDLVRLVCAVTGPLSSSS